MITVKLGMIATGFMGCIGLGGANGVNLCGMTKSPMRPAGFPPMITVKHPIIRGTGGTDISRSPILNAGLPPIYLLLR